MDNFGECSNSGVEKTFLFDIQSKIYIATDSSPVDMQSYELCSDMIDIVLDMTLIYTSDQIPENAASVISLDNGMILYLCSVNRYYDGNCRQLALVSLIREEQFLKQGLIDYNFRIAADAINKVFL